MSDVEEIEGETIYARYGNPSRNSVEAILASLEGAEHAMCFSSGIQESYMKWEMQVFGDSCVKKLLSLLNIISSILLEKCQIISQLIITQL